jgi:hypothetical protein
MAKIVVTIDVDTDTLRDTWQVEQAAKESAEAMMSLAAFQSVVTSEVIE